MAKVTHSELAPTSTSGLKAKLDAQPRRVITYLWFSNLIFVLVLFVVAITAAALNDEQHGGSKSAGFAGMFTALLCVGLNITGTLIMRKVFSIIFIVEYFVLFCA
jgi:hypothetical protein